MSEWGAFAFGVVLGWFTYFTNRYRKGDAQFSDITTLLGVIGGGAITALFGDAKTALFGAYGVGLAVGFFAYFLTLLVMVQRSKGVFGVTWFLDGRRKKLGEDEVISPETRTTTAPMDADAPAGPAPSPLASAVAVRDQGIVAVVEALRELSRQIGETIDDGQRALLRGKEVELTQKLNELVALRLKDVLDSPQVRAALAKLEVITSELVAGAQEMKSVTDKLATATKMIDRATKVIGFLGGVFA